MISMLSLMLVLMLFTISSIGDPLIVNDVSSISSQFTLSTGLPPTIDEIQYYPCC
jgi:hypothetical protein